MALLVTACKKKDTGKIPAAFEGCLAEMADIQKFAETGLQGVEADQIQAVLGERLDQVGAACKPVFAQKNCSNAVAGMKQALVGGTHWMDVCRNVFCMTGVDHPECKQSVGSGPLLEAIWTQDWGAKAALAMRKRVEELNLNPHKISALLMKQVLSAPIEVDMDSLSDQIAAEAPTGAMTLTLSGSSVVIEGDGIAEPIAAKDMDALAESLVKVSSALSPGGTSVSLLASDTTNYQQVVDVMDRLIEAGFKSISIGSPTEEEGPSSSKDPSKEELAKAAVVTLSKTTVFVDDEPVGEISAGVESWQAAMVAALKAGHPGSSVLIIQADKAVLHKTLVAVIDAARPAGFVDIAFAVDAEE